MKLTEIDKEEFISKLDGSFREKLYQTFIYAYVLGTKDGMFQDRDRKGERELHKTFEEWLEEL